MSQNAVEFREVSFHFSGRMILDRLSLDVPRGSTLVLVGRSGSGKTTALKLVNRLLEPAAGEIHVEGRSTRHWDPIQLRRHIGYVIQEVGLFPHFTVYRNVALVPRLMGWPESRVKERAGDMLKLAGLEPGDFLERYPAQLSGGQRQRVGVARALAADPPVLLMDEPFGALDPITRSEIQEEFKSLQARLKKTILFVTHDLPEALYVGSRIALLESGRLCFCGTPSELLASPLPAVKEFLKPVRQLLQAVQ